MVTLESGRVKPDDVTTIKLVLESIPQLEYNQYSIIINKVSSAITDILRASQEAREILTASLAPPSLKFTTESIFYFPLNINWIDQVNQWEKPSHDLLSFISRAPEISISPSTSILPISFKEFEKIVEQLRLEIKILREDNAALRQALARLMIPIPPPVQATGNTVIKLVVVLIMIKAPHLALLVLNSLAPSLHLQRTALHRYY